MDAIIGLLLMWIASHTDYDTAAMPRPQVIEMTPQQLTGEFYAEARHLMPADGVDERINALYSAIDGAHGTIYILAATEAPDAEHFDDPYRNPLFLEILLHELVHHAQWQSGAADTWPCRSFGEREAYLLGGRYLRERRVDDPLKNRMFWAHMYARC
jgi:hypothetical protein